MADDPETTHVGFTPYPLIVDLASADSDFITTIRTSDGSPFATGAAIDLKLVDTAGVVTVWAATVTADTAAWNIDKTEVVALGPGSQLTAHIRYSDAAGLDLTWFSGLVIWHD